jgi:hypothetical protein
VAADLRGDLLGAKSDVEGRPQGLRDQDTRDDFSRGEIRWLSPLALWTGILAGPITWAIDLTASYALVKWTCSSQREAVLHAITVGALLTVAAGAMVSFVALRHAADGTPTDGGDPRQRARFMAILGLASCALFALQIASTAIPQWVLDACH